MTLAAPETIDADELTAAVLVCPWKIEPHTLAEHVTDGRWRAWRHLEYVGRRITDAIAAGGGRLIVNMPPGHGKSGLLSHWTPVWLLDNRPQTRVILASHGAELASHWGRLVRNEFEHSPLLTTRLAEDSQAADRWNTSQGGGMVTTGVGGGITGWRGNVLLIDDPHPTLESVQSPIQRERVIDWFGGTLYDRAEPDATIILLMHRWHVEDLAGFLIEKHSDPWEVIRLPALAEAGDPLGREAGEALCPERYTREALEVIRPAVGPVVWPAKYQQNPEGAGTGRLYHQFTQADNVDKTLALRPDLPLQVSFDFNRNPGMHVEVGQYDARADLFTAVHEIHGPYMKLGPSLEALGKLAADLGGFRWPSLEVYGDATGTQERAETTLTCYQAIVKYLNGTGWPYHLKVPKANPPVRDRVETFNAALHDGAGEVHYKAHPRCERLLADLREMKEDEQGLEDKRDQKLSHASSAEGYRVHWIRPLQKAKPARMYGGSTIAAAR